MVHSQKYWKSTHNTSLKNPSRHVVELGRTIQLSTKPPLWSFWHLYLQELSTHINFDGVHLTENMHQHLSDLFFNQGFCTPSFADLIKMKKGQY
ncbi:hypothetical protein CFP56_004686 [Quercus suber]|uniref:Maturase K n=1 Tax=Quercus suber TaxID=58331 RepID=A0AAW0LA65_QUESU